MVHAADIQDRVGAEELLMKMAGRFGRLKLIWADGGYAGEFVRIAKEMFGRVIEIVSKYPVKCIYRSRGSLLRMR